MKNFQGYTIKSTSEEGVYYLVNHWQRHKTFWVSEKNIKPEMLFKTVGYAQRSLRRLLEVMDDYKTDKFDVVKVVIAENDLHISEIAEEVAEETCPFCNHVNEFKVSEAMEYKNGKKVIACEHCGSVIFACSLCDGNGCGKCNILEG